MKSPNEAWECEDDYYSYRTTSFPSPRQQGVNERKLKQAP
jgi:hypothetical protein